MNTAIGLFGVIINVGDRVIVPEPNDTDVHNHSFSGTVTEIADNENCIVEDGDGECFEIEGNRLELDTE